MGGLDNPLETMKSAFIKTCYFLIITNYICLKYNKNPMPAIVFSVPTMKTVFLTEWIILLPFFAAFSSKLGNIFGLKTLI